MRCRVLCSNTVSSLLSRPVQLLLLLLLVTVLYVYLYMYRLSLLLSAVYGKKLIAYLRKKQIGETVKKYLIIFCALMIAAVAATYARYQSLHPCDWMQQNMVQTYDLPALLIRARIRAAFLLDGVFDPTPGDCLLKWWEFKAEGLPEA